MQEMFTSDETCEILGMTSRALKTAIDEGLIDLVEGEKKKPGKRRRLTRTHLVTLAVAQILAEHDFRAEQIRQILTEIMKNRVKREKLNPSGFWRERIKRRPIGPYSADKTTRSRVRLIIMDIESRKRPVSVRFTAQHKPNLKLPQHGGIRIVPIEVAYRKVEKI